MKLPAVVLGVIVALPCGVGLAALPTPPPPPPAPPCTYCNGPPPPPTPVPTLAPTVIPVQSQPIEVKLSPDQVKRGQQTQVSVKAGAGTPVTIVVEYPHIKPATFTGKVGIDRSFTKVWRVPKTLSPGKITVRIKVDDPDQPYTASFVLTVKK